PCGNFTHRGCYTSVYAYPISCFLQSAIGVAPENAGPVSKESILNAAQLTAEDEINISAHDANSMWAVLNVLALLPPRLRLKMWSIAALVSQLEVPPALTRVSTDIEVLNELLRLEDDIDSVTEAWDMWDKLPEDDEGNKYLETALLPVWALAIFSKSCLLGRGGDESTQDSLKSIFKTWFDVVGDRQFRAQRDERGYSYNPVTLATAIALPGRRTHAVWAKLRTFFDEQDGCKELVETEGQGDDVETMYFPLTHLLIELDHEGTGKPRASANEKAGEDMVMQAMWPIAIIGRALGKPLDASIADFIEEADMPNRDEIHRRVQIALAARSH
ncbi:MAG: hypothetical protein JXA89_01525, partial [Anaerolineae bacterium]|nr:hypothetical protein [Anaerolineae bacterium]